MENTTILIDGQRVDVEYDFDPIVCHIKVDGLTIDLDDEEHDDIINLLLDNTVKYADSVTLDLPTLNLLSDIEDYLTSNWCEYTKKIK
jgi:hypothetical protein